MLSNLTSFDESERADYLVALAAMVASDGQVTSEELLCLRELCHNFVLGPTARGRVITATTAVDEIDEVLARLGKTRLKHSLILDLCLTAYWDGQLDQVERDELSAFGQKLGLESGQVAAVLALAEDIVHERDHKKSLQAALESGVPQDGLAMAAALKDQKIFSKV